MSIKNIIEKNIKVAEVDILVLKKDIKNFHLNVLPPNGKVRISVPLDTTDDAVRSFAITKLSWIRKQRDNFQNQARQTPREYISWESHYLRGDRYILNVISSWWPVKIEIRNKKYIDFYVPADYTILQKARAMDRWYREHLKIAIPPLISKRETILWIKIESWGISKMKRLWWTADLENKKINFNFELVKKTPESLEYIVVHEMIHFLERTHNDVFVAYMDKHLPKRRLYRNELNEQILSYE